MNAATKIAADTAAKEDLYYGVHKGLRLGNARMLIELGQLDAADDAAVWSALSHLEDTLRLGLSHLTHENAEIHAVLETRLPGASDHAADDHDHHLRTFDELRALAQAVAVAGPDRPARLRRLYQRFALFMSDDLAHMHEEETVLQPLMEANFSNEELVAIRERIVGNIPPEKMVLYMRIMLPAFSRPERIGMLSGMRDAMPAGAFEPFMEAVAGKPWAFGDWKGLETALCSAA
jgi:hypothetical protein